MKLALYGGSFDPPHIGHVRVALKAIETLGIDKLIIVPAYRNPLKSSICADGIHRIEWLKQIFAPYSNIEISEYEINAGRSVFTIETVQHYAQRDNTIYLIIGADNLKTLHAWHDIEHLKSMVTLVVAMRNEIPIPEDMITLAVNESFSSTDFRSSLGPLGLEEHLENEIITYYKEHYEPTN